MDHVAVTMHPHCSNDSAWLQKVDALRIAAAAARA